MLESNLAISIKNLSKTYTVQSDKHFHALKNIHFDVEKGKVLGIIGSNGAGKSTLLKILSEVIPPTSGIIEYNGIILSILEIGTGFHHDLSGYENIFFNASLLGMKKEATQKVVEEIIEFSGIRNFILEPVKSYSSGMYLRLAFSIALHVNFDILLLDEVIAVGDAEFRVKAIEKLKQKIRQGKTCIIISHDLHSIANLCDDCIVLQNGEIVYKGSVKDAVDEYATTVDNKMLGQNISITEHEKCRFISSNLNKESYYLNEAVHLTVEFEKYCEEDIDIVIKVRNFDSYILSDCEIYRPDYKQKGLPKGRYQTVCSIPANLFSAGSYKIDLIFGDKNITLFEIKSAAKFKMLLPEWEKQKKWNEKDEGIPFRPVCDWKTTEIK